MNGRLAVFTKTPGRSPVKTRLAAELGEAPAHAFFARSVAAVTETVQAFLATHPGWTAAWHVAEEDAVDDPRWRTLPAAVWTGPGDLGARMARAWTAGLATHGASLLLGADAPQVDEGDLAEAAEALASGRTVLGPATDGGFWLAGGTAPLPAAAWTDTPWSSPDTLRRFRPHLGDPVVLRSLTDVDTAADIAPCLRAFRPPVRGARARAADWLREH